MSDAMTECVAFLVVAVVLRLAMRYFEYFVAGPGHGAYFEIGYALIWLLLGLTWWFTTPAGRAALEGKDEG